MSILQYIIGAVIFVLAIVLVVFISMQQGKRKGLENVISGNSSNNSYLNKTEAAKKGKKFERWTLILAVVFAVLVILLYIITTVDTNKNQNNSSSAAVTSSQAATASSTEETSTEEGNDENPGDDATSAEESTEGADEQ